MIYLFLLLVAVPVTEIYLFILLGGAIGGLETVAVVILTALLGGYLLRREGLSVLRELQEQLHRRANPSEQVAQGLLVLFAGALLLTPGFLTDFVGFMMIFPVSRRWLGRGLVRWFMGRLVAGEFRFIHRRAGDTMQDNYSATGDDDVIEVNEDEDEFGTRQGGGS